MYMQKLADLRTALWPCPPLPFHDSKTLTKKIGLVLLHVATVAIKNQ